MKIQELQTLYARLPQVKALARALEKQTTDTIAIEGLVASGKALMFSSLFSHLKNVPMLFIMQDSDEAGYFYHDLTQVMGEKDVLFFPSSYRRAIKYAQKDAPSEILRTEVLTKLTGGGELPYIVSYPEALAEMVVTRKKLDSRMLSLEVGQTVGVDEICNKLHEFGFHEVDYVYEPGQFAMRGSILDVFSFSHEFPFRIDFFGDDIDTIRTFEVENQLSREKCERVDIVPELS